jgi:hypothetical protein
MPGTGAVLHCFAYGEHVDGLAQRSLGYRLLAPAQAEPWSAEVEMLAHRLQAAPYPDHWPPTDLFCSVLLGDGQRLIAVARYGLADHTPSHRRGGLELIGVVGPAGLSVQAALSVYQWLRQRRASTEDLHAAGGTIALTEVVSAVPPPAPPTDPVPVLPVRLWQEGALLFAATAPSDSDHRVNLLEQGAGGTWQWLPLVGADFPLQTFAQRGPLVAWTPHLAGFALKLEPPGSTQRPAEDHARSTRRARFRQLGLAALLLALVALMAGNLWATLVLTRRVATANVDAKESVTPQGSTADDKKPVKPAAEADESREQFAEALYKYLADQSSQREWDQIQEQLQTRYDRAARDHKDLRLRSANGRAAVGAVSLLSERSASRIEAAIRKALLGRGFDEKLVQVACQRIREHLIEEAKKGP